MNFNFFLNSLSIHQAPLIRELSKNNSVNVYYDIGLSNERKRLGWEVPPFGKAQLKKLTCATIDFNHICSAESVNIFSGLKAYPNVHNFFLKVVSNSKSKNFIQMEKINLLGIKGIFRAIKYKLLLWKFSPYIEGVLCQGSKEQIEALGKVKAHDFGYYLDSVDKVNRVGNITLKLLFIGSLCKRKRILELTSSLNNLKDKEFFFDIYGAAHDVSIDDLEHIIANDSRINYRGVIKHVDLNKVISDYDYLILPSKREGWGVVVSEALLNGVGVFVSKDTGISTYISKKLKCNVNIIDFSSMELFIEKLANVKPLNISEREKIQRESYTLTSVYGVDKLIQIITNT